MINRTIRCLSIVVVMLMSGILNAQTCPAGLTLVNPTSNYTVNGNGTVTDNITGLMWMRCSVGQTWNGATCTGGATLYTWSAALAAAEALVFVTETDWRLPNVKEQSSIVETACFDPSVNETIFPATPNNWYWVSTPYVGAADSAWMIHAETNYDGTNIKTSTFPIRLVRGG